MEPIKGKVLLVEDNADTVAALRDRLPFEGYVVEHVGNGKDVMDRALAFHPDIILLDVMLPELDGYSVCKLLRADAQTKDVPIIMMTAKTTVVDVSESYSSGANLYMAKPISMEKLLTNMERLVTKK
jgi:DNA-binding response OmpR family regulator